MKKIVLFLSVFLTSLIALGQQITGTVRDKNGKQLAGVTLRNTSTSNSTQTDDQGNFKISGKSGGSSPILMHLIPLPIRVN